MTTAESSFRFRCYRTPKYSLASFGSVGTPRPSTCEAARGRVMYPTWAPAVLGCACVLLPIGR